MTANVSLNCKADRVSFYYWERKYGEIPSNAVGVSTSILTLVNLRSEDIGQYRCVATNGSGTNKSDYADVIINSKLQGSYILLSGVCIAIYLASYI